MIHQPGKFYTLVEVEKHATESIFHFLKEIGYSVLIEPTKEIIENYAYGEKETIVDKTLISEAPTQTVENIDTVTLEKMLVDVYCDQVIFLAQQGSEMKNIFREALEKYVINENKLFRYATRRGKQAPFKDYFNTILQEYSMK